MNIYPIWKSLYYETTASSVEYRVMLEGVNEIFHGKAHKSPETGKTRIKVNDICASYLNSLLEDEELRRSLGVDTLIPMNSYAEFLLEIYNAVGSRWDTVMSWGFINDTSWEERETGEGRYSEPINRHAAPDQMIPYSYLVINPTYTICYNGTSPYFTITKGEAIETEPYGGTWEINYETNLDNAYYVFSGGQTGYTSGGTITFNLPANTSDFTEEYTTVFYESPGGQRLNAAVAYVNSSAQTGYYMRLCSNSATYNADYSGLTYIRICDTNIPTDGNIFELVGINHTDVNLYSGYTGASGDTRWVKYDRGTNSFYVTMLENGSESARSDTMTFWLISDNTTLATYTINQRGTEDSGSTPYTGTTARPNEYLSFTAIDDIQLSFYRELTDLIPDSWLLKLDYSTDSGQTWAQLPTTQYGKTLQYVTIPSGTTVLLRGNASDVHSGSRWLGGWDGNYGSYNFSKVTGRFTAQGNVLSLIYGDDFRGRTDTVPEYGLYMLFKDTEITDASGMALPSALVGDTGYTSMFLGCTELLVGPELTASRAMTNAYAYMFQGCTSLGYVKCLLTNPSTETTWQWLNGASASGTFVKKASANWPSGDSGIPQGWTIENA